MKTSFIIRLEQFEIRNFTDTIKNMWDYAKIVMDTLRFLKYNYHRCIRISEKKKITSNKAFVKLDLINIPRIYIYISEDKYISFVFPFNIKEKDQSIYFYYLDIELNEKIISEIFTILESQKDMKSSHGRTNSSVIELYLSNDYQEPLSEKAYYVVERLISTEPGYLRHDHDSQNANGRVHPEYHIDINFSQDATFKYGLNCMLTSLEFEIMFDKRNDCLYFN